MDCYTFSYSISCTCYIYFYIFHTHFFILLLFLLYQNKECWYCYLFFTPFSMESFMLLSIVEISNLIYILAYLEQKVRKHLPYTILMTHMSNYFYLTFFIISRILMYYYYFSRILYQVSKDLLTETFTINIDSFFIN